MTFTNEDLLALEDQLALMESNPGSIPLEDMAVAIPYEKVLAMIERMEAAEQQRAMDHMPNGPCGKAMERARASAFLEAAEIAEAALAERQRQPVSEFTRGAMVEAKLIGDEIRAKAAEVSR